MVAAALRADDGPMTDDQTTTTQSPGAGPHPPMGGLTRSRRDRMIGGVAGGVAERLDVDPLIVRGAFVILAVAGGSGLVLYLLGWLLLPDEGGSDSIAGRALTTRSWDSRRTRDTTIAVLIALGFLAVAHPWHWSFGASVFIAVALLAIAALSRHRSPGPGSPTPGLDFHGPAAGAGAAAPVSDFRVGADTGGKGDGGGDGDARPDPTIPDPTIPDPTIPDPTMPFTTAAFPGGYSPTTFTPGNRPVSWSPSVDPRPPSLIPPLLAALAALAGVSAVIAAIGWVSVPLPAVLAVALAMSLVALIAGARRSRFLGATLVSLALAGMLVLSTAVPHPLAGGIGQRTWHPAGAGDLQPSYRLGTGQATLDLSEIPPGVAHLPVRVSLGTGDLTVIVAKATAVEVRERAAIGGTDLFGDRQGGVSVDRSSVVAGDPDTGGGGGGAVTQSPLHLDLQVGIGAIEVRRASS
jgi:phage shock protein PspC (stress-responsive transcriptional regulator)